MEDNPSRKTTWKQALPHLTLYATLLLPTQAAAAFLIQGGWAIFGGELFGFPAMGIAPATGEEAVRVGTSLALIGLVCALVSGVGLFYSLRAIRLESKTKKS
ncbi:MAG: hypothetical protein ACO1SV_13755 [Fimbriimonas sp.]